MMIKLKCFYLLSVLITLTIFPGFKYLQLPSSYKKYCNERFEYYIEYPSNILIPQEESQNGDGREFISKDKKCTLIVYGSNAYGDFQEKTLKGKFYKEDLVSMKEKKNTSITYKVLKPTFYIISAMRVIEFFIRKQWFLNRQMGLLFLRFPFHTLNRKAKFTMKL